MQFHDNDNRETTGEFRPIGSDPAPQSFSSIVGVLLLAFAGVAGGALFYLSRETNQNHQLAAANQSLTDSLAQVRSQLQSVSQQVSDLNAVRAAEAAAKERAAQQRIAPQRIARVDAPATRPQQRDDPRFKQLQEQLSTQGNQLADQQKQIETARGDLDKTRDDLQGAISSTHDELSGSIAKSHEEIMALQKRGERNYYEFDLAKGKNYQRVGPLNLSLRKSNTKRKSFDMMMLVDDNQLQKKNVNLYEPVWINLGDFPQPLELVVNQIGKDTVHGYLSEPKYKKSDLDTSASLGPLKQ